MIPQALKNFPKKAIELPEDFRNIYNTHYKKNRRGETKTTSLSMKMERWLHKKVANDVKDEGKSTLEIGAGTLNQLNYEPKVDSYDIVEPFKELYENSPQLSRIGHIYNDISDIDPKKRYQRITSVATFEHILDLPAVVAKSVLLLRQNGSLRVSIPNEGTFMWKLGTMFTGAEFKKMYGLDYQILLKHEHVNTAAEIEAVLKYFFKNTKTEVFGINKRIAFYMYICCKKPNIDKAKEYLKLRNIN
jgi:2-polyprenyl-3-methyl-5-hydroxy-6-metoxy-1,4-benzoquinol methylase